MQVLGGSYACNTCVSLIWGIFTLIHEREAAADYNKWDTKGDATPHVYFMAYWYVLYYIIVTVAFIPASMSTVLKIGNADY